MGRAGLPVKSYRPFGENDPLSGRKSQFLALGCHAVAPHEGGCSSSPRHRSAHFSSAPQTGKDFGNPRSRPSASGYHHRAGARTFLSAAAFKGLHRLESRRTVAAIGACCGQECPRSGGGVEIRPEACPDRYEGRGIVICGGGVRYFTNAWVCVQMLRRLGCALPIQLWHLGAKEMDGRMQALVAPLGVECVDAFKSRKKYPVRRLHGWELKPYAILHCRFREVLFLDADNVPVVNPEFLFDTPRYQASGAIFWPDYEAGKNEKLTAIWRSCGMRQPDEPEFETGQIVVDKRRCWRALRLSLWFNEHSDFYYRYLHGDKETFHLAFRK